MSVYMGCSAVLVLLLPAIGLGGVQEKIEWNVVKLGGKDPANVNVLVSLDSLKEGKMVGLPTDTVYGFVADATRIRSVMRLYNSTGPTLTHLPLTIAVDDVNQMSLYADVDHLDRAMLNQLLPGRVTVVVPRRPNTLPNLNPDYEVIPIRIPGQKKDLFLRKLTNQFGRPLGLVGARKVGQPHSRQVEDFEAIRLRAYVVFDAGKMERQKMEGSTIVDLTQAGSFKILWAGCVEPAVRSILTRYDLVERTSGENVTVFNPT